MTDELLQPGLELQLIASNDGEYYWSEEAVEIETIDVPSLPSDRDDSLVNDATVIISGSDDVAKDSSSRQISQPKNSGSSSRNFWQDFIYGFYEDEQPAEAASADRAETTIASSSLSTEDSGIESLDSTPLDNEDAGGLAEGKNPKKRGRASLDLRKSPVKLPRKKKRTMRSREVIVGDDSPIIAGDFGTKRLTRLELKKQADKPVMDRPIVDKTPGKLVWGFWRKWYPAIVIRPEDAGMFASAGKVWVFWIGESRISEISDDSVEPFTKDFRERLDQLAPQITAKETTRKNIERVGYNIVQLLRPYFPSKSLTKPYALWLKKVILSDEERNKKILDDLILYPYPGNILEKLGTFKKQNSGKTKKYLHEREMKELNKTTEVIPPPKKTIKTEKIVTSSGGINIKDQKPGMIVWAKLEGYSWWPCVIMDYQKINHRQPYVAHQWVLWYEDYMYSQIEFRQIISFLKGIDKMKMKIETAKDSAFSRAVLQATRDFCEKVQYPAKLDSIADVIKLFYLSKERFKIKDKQLSAPSEDAYSQVIQDQLRDQVRGTPVGQKRKDQILKSKTLKSALKGELSFESFCIMCFDCNELREHPFFYASLCRQCRDDFTPRIFAYGIDRKCFFCCLCGNDDLVAVCDNMHCPKVFCTACIKYIMCPDLYEDILLKHPWECFICDPNQLEARKEIIKIREDWRTRSDSVYRNSFDGETLTNAGQLGGATKIRVLSLFDGIATGLLVLKNLNIEIECYYASEIDPDSMEVSKFNHGNEVIQIGDVRCIDEKKVREIAPIDLMIGGSPCNELSLANPKRRGLDDPAGTGVLFYEYCRLLRLVKKHNKKKHLFWLFENVASMPKKYRDQISENLGREPKFLDSADFSAQHRPRLYWSNLPWGYFEKIDVYLQDMLNRNCNREALVKKIMTVTTRSNSINQTKENLKPVIMNGEPDTLWVTELEEIFGFPRHYTDVNISKTRRQQLLGKAWSVQTLEAIFRPLFYLTK